jgi:nitrogen-specific signal transduction histidine kinase/DNA-binding NarL/FixJ family response regulator
MTDPNPAAKGPNEAAVLVISSDSSFYAGLAGALEAGGVMATVGGDPSWAVDELAKGRHAAVVVDTDGLGGEAGAVVARLRKLHPDRAMFVTATHPSKSLLTKLSQAAPRHFMLKPVDAAQAARLIRLACRGGASGVGKGGVRTPRAVGKGDASNKHGSSRGATPADRQLQSANEALRKQVSQLTILYQMGRDISENENWSDALDRFLMAMVSYTKADGAALLLFSRNGQRLSVRSNFHVDEPTLARACAILGTRWRENPRGSEIHSIESYDDRLFSTCLERLKPWRLTVAPMRYRSFVWGFVLIDKSYQSNVPFRQDYAGLTTIQTILAEEVANASYISDLRQLSRFNQKVLENIQSGVVTTDLEGFVVFWNHLAQTMCPKLASGVRVHFDELCRTPSEPEGLFSKIMDSDKDTHVLEVSYFGKHDRESPGRFSITKMHDDNLNGTVLVGILEDLTEQKKMEAEIRRTDRLRVLGQVSAGMAHEIGNPLTGIMTTAQLLARHVAHDQKMLGDVRIILDEAARLRDILANLKHFARSAKPEIRRCVVADVLGRVVSLSSDQAEKKGIEIRIRDDLGARVCMADPNQLEQVLLNLVLNAMDACDRGNSVEIVLSDEPDPDDTNGGFARIEVIDDGPGVPPEIRDALFEPFVTTKVHGTGLGLSISRQIMKEHHGDIRCDFLERGTRFTIRLPLGRGEKLEAKRTR